ncbi:hypothetical protein [Kitasatospora sp. DSM 101779]|uniref:hypothetical protein n=1 Tax=Kitasatospora sp. DSM 101779 TaxID=2853165 RepID=UPI0021DA29C9|nr:hypothetical protein [Kitasatospora sp. DSM 101779]MCU7822219.1 hypothetical protein [Kitasatospora sp. DSM 101779]
MRPSYDADLPASPTPIYDALYSEYRRLFRALPGDRSDEEQLRFSGFGWPGGYSGFGASSAASYPQHQVFETYAGHAHGTPQFVSESRAASAGYGGRPHGTDHHQGRLATQAVTVGHQAGHTSAGHGTTGHTAGHAVGGTGQGWVAAGYLGQQPTTAAGGGRHRSLLSLPPGRSAEQSF